VCPGSNASANLTNAFVETLGTGFKIWRLPVLAMISMMSIPRPAPLGGGFVFAVGGGTVGTLVAPGPGTAIGALGGTITGGVIGGYAGRQLGGQLYQGLFGRWGKT
jgi:hypothetical protein